MCIAEDCLCILVLLDVIFLFVRVYALDGVIGLCDFSVFFSIEFGSEEVKIRFPGKIVGDEMLIKSFKIGLKRK